MLSICTVLLATFGVSEIPEPAFSVNASAVEPAKPAITLLLYNLRTFPMPPLNKHTLICLFDLV